MPQVTQTEVRLALQVALLGAVFPTLRAVYFELNQNKVTVHHFVDCPISEDDLESIQIIDTELLASFEPTIELAYQIHTIPMPTKVHCSGLCVFSRKEPDLAT